MSILNAATTKALPLRRRRVLAAVLLIAAAVLAGADNPGSGGTLDLVQHVNGCDKAGALAWLVDARLIAPRGGADPARIRRNRRRGARIATRIAREAACERSAAAKWYLGNPQRRPRPSWRRLRRN